MKTKRIATLFVRMKPANKTWLMKKAKEQNAESFSLWFDQRVEQERKNEKNKSARST